MTIPRRELIAHLKEDRRDLMERVEAIDAALKAFGSSTEPNRRTGHPMVQPKITADPKVISEVVRVLNSAKLGGSGTVKQIYEAGIFKPRSKSSVWDHIKASDQFHITGKGRGQHPFVIHLRGNKIP